MKTDVYLTVAGYSFTVTPTGLLAGTSLSIREYTERFRHFSFNPVTRRREVTGWWRLYDRRTGRVYLPRYDLHNFVHWLRMNDVEANLINTPPVMGDKTTFGWSGEFSYRTEVQQQVVEGLTLLHDGIFPIAAQTGAGKTVSIFRSAENKCVRTMVTMRTRLDQWEGEFYKFTNATQKQLYIIKGRESLERLVMLREEGRMPDFIIASIQTMRKYVTGDPDYQDLPSPREFCEYFGIGMIGMDEFHEHLESNYLMMIGFNPAIWAPITATFKKKDEFLNTVVKGFAPVNKRLGADKYHSFVDVFGYECDMGHGVITRDCYMGPRGYSGTKLEKFFIKKGKKFFKQFFIEYFVPLFKEHYLKKRVEGDRVFIMFTLVEMCYFFQKLMTEAFPEIGSAVYVSGVSRNVLTEKELILTTPGSGGTGTDAPNVRSVFSFVAMAQETPLEQHLGRIRFDKHYKLMYEFVYIFFTRVHSHVDYEEIREPLYREKGISYKKRSFPP